MKNLEALIRTHRVNAAKIENFDKMYKFPLKEAGFNSFDDLKGMDDWLDFIIHAKETMGSEAYAILRRTYLIRFKAHNPVKGIDK